MHRAARAECLYCFHWEDTAEHTVFDCPHWTNNREALRPFLNGRLPRPEDVEYLLCGPSGLEDIEENVKDALRRDRVEFINMVESILANKEED